VKKTLKKHSNCNKIKLLAHSKERPKKFSKKNLFMKWRQSLKAIYDTLPRTLLSLVVHFK
jgi:hypothetical protein